VQPSAAVDPGTPDGPGRRRLSRTVAFWAAVVVLGAGAGAGATLIALHERRASPSSQPLVATPPPVTWPAGARRAPDFRLADQHGAPISLHSLLGRAVIVTFLDPLCTNVCPLEARVLADAIRGLPPARRPAIVAVSVDPRGDTRASFRADASRWRLTAGWRWAIGSPGRLAAVWRKYEIEVKVVTARTAGKTVREVEHSDASFVVDRAGYQRAMFLYPFTATDVQHEILSIESGA